MTFFFWQKTNDFSFFYFYPFFILSLPFLSFDLFLWESAGFLEIVDISIIGILHVAVELLRSNGSINS